MSMLSNSGANSTAVMYPVKPIFDHNIKIDIPDVMYKVASFHGGNLPKQKEAISLDPVAALEKRQESILARLTDLRQTLEKLTSQYSIPSDNGAKTGAGQVSALSCHVTSTEINSSLGSGIHDIVVSADPEKPPLSLFILHELIKKQYKVLGTSYVHSSVISMDPRLTGAVLNGSQVTRGSHQIALSLIWKKDIYIENGPILMISPTKQTAVRGEVNIARYINRVISCESDIIMATQIDEWLDIAHVQILNGNTKEKAAALRNLNSRLGKNEWLVGSALSLADIVMWSALHQTKQATGAPANVKKWLKKCDENPLFTTTLALL